MSNVRTRAVTPTPWRHADPGRVQLGRFAATGPLAWTLSRLGGVVTGGGRVRAIEAIGLTPGMMKYFAGFFAYVNSLSRLSRTDTELVILRTAWNCGAYYEWYQHVYVSRLGRLSADDVARVGLGPDARGWDERQRALLTAVDELTADRIIGDATWARLRAHYANRQLTDLCLLVGLYAMLAMLLKSVGAEPEADAWQRRPLGGLRRGQDLGRVLSADVAGVPDTDLRPVSEVTATGPSPEVSATRTSDVVTRLAPSPHFRAADPGRISLGAFHDVGPLTWVLSHVGGFVTRAGRVVAADAIGMDPRMMRHYLPFAFKLVVGSHLSRADTELATLRTTWNAGVRYEWYYHAYLSRLSGVSQQVVERVAIGPSADGWTERQRALLTAVDELCADRLIGDDTWTRLRACYDERKLASLCLLVGHYDMLAMLFKSFGVEPEPGALRSGPLASIIRTVERRIDARG